MTRFKVANKSFVTFIVALALFMDALDTTIINTAIPAMATSLKVHPVNLKIALISYLLSLAIFIPISGWLADKLGLKRVFMSALGIFTLSSLWCGYASQLFELVIARGVQGLGGALMLPLGRLILLRNFERHEVVQAMSMVILIVSVGPMLGPLAGGVITDRLSWHWVFWINIPFGLLALSAASFWLTEVPPRPVRSFDFLGFLLFGGGLAGLTFSFSELSETTANMHTASMIMCLSIFMLCLYFLRPNKHHHPILNLALFRSRTFRIAVAGNLLARLGFGALPFLLPLLLQVGLGYSAELSGLLLMPVAFGMILVKVIFLRILRMVGFKRLLLINTFLAGLSLWSFQAVTAALPLYVIAALTFFFGFFISLQYSGMNSLAYADIHNDDLSSATSVMSMFQQLSQSFGVAAGAILLRYFSSNSTGHFSLTPPVFHQTFFTMGLFTFLVGFIFIRMRAEDGHQMLAPPLKKLTSEEETA